MCCSCFLLPLQRLLFNVLNGNAMKFKSYLVWLGLFLSVMMSGCTASKQATNEEKVANEIKLRNAIEARSFIVEVDKAMPMSGSMRTLTSPYSLTINGEEIKSHLPYFGRAYTVPYGGGEGLIFESTITDYQLTFDKKNMANIEFKTKTNEDLYTYRIQIFTNGSSSIHVSSNNRQPISFSGKATPKNIDK